ncbi:MAG: hypothetical protein WAO95_07645 [Burkholderiales bacterium]
MTRRRLLFPLLLLLAGCGSMSVDSLWPFGTSESQERDRRPANATEYRCSDGKTFYVRNLEGGAVWLMAPDRDVRLEKLADGRYGVGRVSLELGAGEATLNDPPSVFVNCKRAG